MGVIRSAVILCLLLLFVRFDSSLSQSSTVERAAFEEFSLEFSTSLSKAVADVDYDFAVSPTSIASLLLLLGDAVEGEAAAQYWKVLRLPPSTNSLDKYNSLRTIFESDSRLGNFYSAYVIITDFNQPLIANYSELLTKGFDADLFEVNLTKYSARGEINTYINDLTRGLIKTVVNTEDLSDSSLVLLSVIYFEPHWKLPFDEKLSIRASFATALNERSIVTMMRRRGLYAYADINELESEVLMIDFKDHYKMMIVLPNRNVTLTKAFANVASFGIGRTAQATRKDALRFVDLSLPKFKVKVDFTLNVILEGMGMTDIFAADADLSKMLAHTNNSTFVRIIHKAHVNLNENSYLNNKVFERESTQFGNPSDIYFNVNRPFVFFILCHPTNEILISGQIENPSEDP